MGTQEAIWSFDIKDCALFYEDVINDSLNNDQFAENWTVGCR